ncbi:hypothetical protein Btru_047324 [Bulinus truncatus]|nr:hypothetical protein Btru_047324 [Bulinus truncatus]
MSVGKECEEVNACEINPCFVGQNCTDLTAEQQGNNPVGYICGPCPTGYTKWNGTCVDIDECYNTKTCDGSCINTEGSYICTCPAGYRLDLTDRKSCKDINECEERTSTCQQKCINNKGNYTCSCYSDYKLDTDGQTCTLDVDECQSDNKPCSHICVNSLGKYDCSCYTGYKLAVDQISCEACKSPYYGENCGNICQCNNRGTCDPVRGCVCNRQWTGVNCEIDVNECTQPDVCLSGYICENTIGSYRCQCPTGYKLENGLCQECDEGYFGPSCSKKCICSLNSNCNKTNGLCYCKAGWNGTNCDLDINECDSGTHKCNVSKHERCVNIQGSYDCVCSSGYANKCTSCECEDINECNSTQNNKCEQTCENLSGGYKCSCTFGYIVSSTDTRKCEDIDECLELLNSPCDHNCSNLVGSYKCSCRESFVINPLNTTQCTKVSQFNASVTFDMNVVDRNLEDMNSSDYKRLKTDIENQLVEKLKEKMASVLSVSVKKLRRGSLISDVIVQMNAENSESALTNAFQDLLSVSFKLDNINVRMITVSVHETTVNPRTCEVRQIINPCLDTEECIVDSGVTACRKKENDIIRLILGLAIGIPAFILLCVIVVTVYCCIIKSKTSNSAYKIECMHAEQNPYIINENLQAKQGRSESSVMLSRLQNKEGSTQSAVLKD